MMQTAVYSYEALFFPPPMLKDLKPLHVIRSLIYFRTLLSLRSETKLRRLCFYTCLSENRRVCLSACWDTTPHPPPGADPLGSRHPPPPRSRHTPPWSRHAPRSRHPHPQDQTTPPGSRHHPPPSRRLLLRTVRILLECILVLEKMFKRHEIVLLVNDKEQISRY